LTIPHFDLVAFAALLVPGIYYRKKPAIHKRLMLLSTLAILPPGVARLPIGLIDKYGLVAAFVLADVAVVACVVYDSVKNRRLHPAFLWGGLWIIVSLPRRLAIAQTAPWHAFANWFFQFAKP
jgi:hypothetical protein